MYKIQQACHGVGPRTKMTAILLQLKSIKYYWDMLLSQQMLAAIIHIADDCKQPLNKVVEALAPNILVQLLSLLHHGTSLHNTLSICLQFVQLQSNFRQLLTAYIADVAGTFKLLI